MIAMLFSYSAEQGHPAVAFNPRTQEYLVVWHISAPSIQGGVHLIVARRVYGHRTVGKSKPYGLANANFGNGFLPVIEPKLMYNAASGKYVFDFVFVKPVDGA